MIKINLKQIIKITLTSLIAALACTGIIYAATTVGTNINTTGTLSVTGVSTLTGNTSITGTLGVTGNSTFTTASSTGIVKFANINSDTGAISFDNENLTTTGKLNIMGLTTLGNASTTVLTVSGNSYLATTTITGESTMTGNIILGGKLTRSDALSECTVACSGGAGVCDATWDFSANTITMTGSATGDFTDCFRVGDGVIAATSGATTPFPYPIRHITNVTATVLTWQDNTQDLAYNNVVDLIFKRLKPFYQIYNSDLSAYLYTHDSMGVYGVHPHQVSAIEGGNYATSIFHLTGYDRGDGTGIITYPTFVASSEYDHTTGFVLEQVATHPNSMYTAFIGGERRMTTEEGSVLAPNAKNMALKVLWQDSSTVSGRDSNQNRWGAGIETEARIKVGANSLLQENMSGGYGWSYLSNGANAEVKNASGFTGYVKADAGTIDIASGFRARDFDNSATMRNAVSFHANDQSQATNNYGVVLDDGADCFWADGLMGVALCSKSVTLSAVEVQGLTTPKTLVTSHGTNTWIEFVSAVFHYNYVQAAFAEPSAPDDFLIEYEGGTDITATHDATGFLDQTNVESRYSLTTGIYTHDLDIASLIDKDLQLLNTGSAYTGGTGTAKVASLCTVLDGRIQSGAHGFLNGDAVTLDATECGVTQDTVYWVCEAVGGTFSLDTVPGCGIGSDCTTCTQRLPITVDASPSGTYTPQSTITVKVVYRVHALGL